MDRLPERQKNRFPRAASRERATLKRLPLGAHLLRPRNDQSPGQTSKETNWHQDAPYWPMDLIGATIGVDRR